MSALAGTGAQWLSQGGARLDVHVPCIVNRQVAHMQRAHGSAPPSPCPPLLPPLRRDTQEPSRFLMDVVRAGHAVVRGAGSAQPAPSRRRRSHTPSWDSSDEDDYGEPDGGVRITVSAVSRDSRARRGSSSSGSGSSGTAAQRAQQSAARRSGSRPGQTGAAGGGAGGIGAGGSGSLMPPRGGSTAQRSSPPPPLSAAQQKAQKRGGRR